MKKIADNVGESNRESVFTSLQCGRQIAQLKEECEETKKTLEEEASKLRQVSIDKISTDELESILVTLVNGERLCPPPSSYTLHLLSNEAFIHYAKILNADVQTVAAKLNSFPSLSLFLLKLLYSLHRVSSSLSFPFASFSDSPLIIFQSVIDSQKGAVAGRHVEGAQGVEMTGERHTVATHRHDNPDLKGTVDV